ncbi:PAS domain S-box protein [Chloracidobacterium thermophilum]|uniref:PAS domain S-box protein n=1 Tax=Chloracidobacterium thermophilum TaxID=458033 RepID=UPI0007387890|nr:PAS domain S-box protein [Chloracidobacterium thermophilum]
MLQPAKTSPGNPAEPLIHIVDDDDTVRRLLTILMEKEGFRVVAHRDGLTALEQAPALQPELVMLDVAMPGMDGITLCRHLRQLDAYRQVPILMLTGLSDDGTVAAAYAAGATDYIPKPLRPEVLRHKVSHLLHSHHIARQLRETANKLRSIVQYANDAILVLDAALHVLELNPKAELLLGAGVVGNMIGELLSTEESLDNLLPHITQTGTVTEATVRNRDGRMSPVELTSSDFYLGTHRRYVLILRDLAGRKPSEKTLEVPSDLPDSRTAVPSQGRGPSEQEPETSDILDALPLGLARLNRRGQIIFVNRHLADLLGERPSRRLGTSGRRYVSRLGWKAYKPALRRFLSHRPLSIAAGEPVVLTQSVVLRKADGCFFPVILSLMPVPGRDEWLALVEDRTRHQKLEERLQRRNAEWVMAVDALSDMILIEDRVGQIRRCNRAVAEFLRRPYSAIIGQTSAALFWGAREGSLAHCVQHPAAFQFPTSDRWFRMSSYWIDQERGIGTGWVHIITDITSQRRSELERGRLIRAIEQVGEAVVTFDRHGRVQFCNPAFEQLTGIRSWEAIGHSFNRLGFGPVDPAVRRDILRHLARGKGWWGRYLARRRDGSTCQQQATISPVRDAHGQLQNVVVVCRDVTEQLRYEAIAEAVNVTENASHIFSAIRHEMGNPINSIKTALTVLRQTKPLSSEAVTTYVERCLSEIGRVEYLLRALRSFSLYETPELKAQPLLPFLERFCTLVKDGLAAQGVDFQSCLASDLGWVNFDARALHQALMNLVSNAVDALSPVPTPQITLMARRYHRLIVIEVRDNGPGIEPKHRDHIFKPFYTTKPQGTGLGLVIARKLLSRMQGTVELQSPPTGGCVAIVTLEALPEDDV